MCLFIIILRRRQSHDENGPTLGNRRRRFSWLNWNQRLPIVNAIISGSAVEGTESDLDSGLSFYSSSAYGTPNTSKTLIIQESFEHNGN